MKRIFSLIVIVCVCLSGYTFSVSANDIDDLSNNSIAGNVTTENKIVCKASIKENFESDSILVALTNKKSIELKEYSAYDL